MGVALRDENGKAQRLPSGTAATNECPGCCGPKDCPFYWRAEHCSFPGCYAYICSTATCIDGGKVGEGTVFTYLGQCFKVSTERKYLPDPLTGDPPPDGFYYIPKKGLVVPDATVLCKGSCADCGGDCVGDCIPGPRGYYPMCDGSGCAGGINGCIQGQKEPTCCCDSKGSIEWEGASTRYMDCGQGPTPEQEWTWKGSVTTIYNDAFPLGVAHIKLTATRKWYACNGNFTTTDYSIDENTGLYSPCMTNFPGPALFAPWLGFETPHLIQQESCSFANGCSTGGIDFVGNGGFIRFRETYIRKPGKSQCGPQCPGQGSEGPFNPAPPVVPTTRGNPGIMGGCPRCSVLMIGAKCLVCGYCVGCGG